ncbi:PorT family protein [Chitinophaga nivalis]|uniref:PorT family protein n=1 Tax=Chitinophaga nivalis TaxID=2991709 RepID=A0ABT3IVL2_9BACT|nr:PorT family protein [Chitinophaga nivalis]MCW3462299.1 PorT family protein [Chitinophaga nivalis]MCW3488010.1 PorT family protein [Chitinophaga nivalis]
MKFVTIAVAAALLVAATSNAQVSLGLRGGYVNARMDAKTSGSNSRTLQTSPLDKWQAGFYLNVPLVKNLYLQPGLSYIVKGAKLDNTPQFSDVKLPGVSAIKLRYLELPVNLVYKVPVSFGKIVAGAGPYVSYCLRGSYDLSVYDAGEEWQKSTQEVDFRQFPNVKTTQLSLQRWDAGINFLAGVELNCFVTLGVNYSLGLMDIDKAANSRIRQHYLGVNIGVLLDREDW